MTDAEQEIADFARAVQEAVDGDNADRIAGKIASAIDDQPIHDVIGALAMTIAGLGMQVGVPRAEADLAFAGLLVLATDFYRRKRHEG